MSPAQPEWLTSPRARIIAGAVAALLVAAIAFLIIGSGGDDSDETTASTTPTAEPEAPPVTEAPGAVYPLLGTPIPAEGEAAAQRPVVVVKIDNADRKARPQFGLTNADVVYEPRVEGGVTRLMALFHSQGSDPVGPVRSFRNTDVSILRMLNRPLFAWHGANDIAVRALNEAIGSGEVIDVGINAVGGAYYRESSRSAPHNSMTNTSTLFDLAPSDAGPPPQLFTYGAPAEGDPVTVADVNYGGGPGSAPVQWRYDAEGAKWLRLQAGTPHTDTSGAQVAVKNVVIQFTDYVDTGQVDTSGFGVPEAQTVGSGGVWILSEGQRFVGRWSRDAATDVISYSFEDGSAIPLSPGQTWVNLPPPGGASVS